MKPMSISEATLADIYNRLATIAINHGLSWVVDEVMESVAVGKILQMKIRPSEIDIPLLKSRQDYPIDGLPDVRRIQYKSEIIRSTFEGVISEEYSNEEKLVLLIEALQTAISYPTMLGRQITNFLWEKTPNLQKIEFVSDDPIESEYFITRESIESISEIQQEVLSKLQQLRETIYSDKSN